MTTDPYPRMASFRTAAALRERLAALGLALPVDDEVQAAPGSPLAQPLALGPGPSGPLAPANRFVIQPMEGWDGTTRGEPSELTERRWRRFGISGAGWIWGGEAVAVVPEGRANPNQLLIDTQTAPALGRLREALLKAAREAGHPRPVVGLQLTHSGRWCMPEAGEPRPRTAYRHPLLDPWTGIDNDTALLRDDEIEELIASFAQAARRASHQGFDFVDLKHCHGYLLHEFLSARERPGPWGGPSLEARSRLAEAIIAAVQGAAPDLRIGLRLSVFDALPHRAGPTNGSGRPGTGAPEPHPLPYVYGFGLDPEAPERRDLSEPVAFARRVAARGVEWINVTAASPYYAPHLQRPALFPPSDGYPPPEDPLVGVVRLLDVARELKAAVPEVTVVSSGWTYLQEWIPNVAQACVRAGWFDAVGLGRMALSYPELPAHVLGGQPLERNRICRTFSDCTTAPRTGLVSGCYPLDRFYRERPERAALEAAKRGGPS
jgi:2,4-dienoyl-CoA reductase-like NADH-dependent reductase (Old Yellow Enzyme family)